MSNKLPSPHDFQIFLEKNNHKRETYSPPCEYDIDDIYRKMVIIDFAHHLDELHTFIHPRIVTENLKHVDILERFLGFSQDYNSLGVTLFGKNSTLQTIAIRRNNAKNSEAWEKWKTYGSKNFIPYSISDNDDVVIIVYGTAEVLLCELLEVSYIAFQSDSIAKNIMQSSFYDELSKDVEGKRLLLLTDNDQSCKDTVLPLKQALRRAKEVTELSMEEISAQKLSKGYDFLDLCNHVADKSAEGESIQENISSLLVKAYKRIKGL